MPARNPGAGRTSIQLGSKAREHIHAGILIKRLQSFALVDPDHPPPGAVRMTRTQVHVALALLRKVLPDLAAIEVSGNPDKPLVVQLVRFSEGDQPEPQQLAKPLIDMGSVVEIDNVSGAESISYPPAKSTG